MFIIKKHIKQGFSLVETVLVVAVLAILVGLSFPAVTRYSQQRDIQMEKNRQLEIRNAIKAYVMDKNTPLTENNWVSTLMQGYTNLSPAELTTDIWGRDRVFRVYQDTTRSIQGSQVPVTYMSLHSAGLDGVATEVSGTAVSAGVFVSGTNVNWWDEHSSLPQRTVLFSDLVAGGDDIMTKMNDYTERLAAYELTVQRIDRVMDGLASYAQSLYTSEVERCQALRLASDPTGDAYCDTAGALEKRIYFPRSTAIYAAEASPFNQYINTTLAVDNLASVGTRRTQMQNLMRTLGLPIDYCCSAIENASDGLPVPFYYFSNPRPRSSYTTCGARPTANQGKLSPRVVTQNVADGVAGATCG